MEPLKPAARARVLAENPEAQPEDVEEYERLLAERFTVDPDVVPVGAPAALRDEELAGEQRESRLLQLYHKLFPREHHERR